MKRFASNLTRAFLSILLSKIFHKVKVVRFEGGLGSQLLSYFEYQLSLKDSTKSTYADCDYFTKFENPSQRWNWELSRYGIEISDLIDYSRHSALLKYRRPTLTSWASETSWRHIRSECNMIFQIDNSKFSEELHKHGLIGDYGVVHVRRGDYLQVASKIISFEMYLSLINKVRRIIPNNLVVISDSRVPDEFIIELQNLCHGKVVVLDDPNINPGLLHDIMRKSKLLIAGNSTFSFTAGLMADDDCTVVVPMDFYNREDLEPLNRNYRNSGQFFIQDI
jgi:hypothetical protein